METRSIAKDGVINGLKATTVKQLSEAGKCKGAHVETHSDSRTDRNVIAHLCFVS